MAEPVKPQTDIYCLGVMLYELLTGYKPFQGPTPIVYIQQHLNEPPPSLVTHHPNLSTTLDPIISRATAKDPADRYPDMLSLLEDFRQALATADRRPPTAGQKVLLYGGLPSQGEAMHSAVSGPELTNPYKGLRAFSEADTVDFFGRETLIQELLRRMSEVNDPTAGVGRELARFLAVVGPSGSGKSSVVRAGLVPALRQGGLPGSDQWFIIEMLPGAHPWEELEAALLRIAVNPPESLQAQLREDERGLLRAVRRVLPADESVELVLIIDQFEELFTLTGDEEVRHHFLDNLVTAVLDPRSRLRLIITLRADFTDRPLRYVDFGELLRQRTEFVLPLTPDELEQAITGPAQRVGLALEPGLTAAISREVVDEPGALPLLQYALTELFERSVAVEANSHPGPLLTKQIYQAIGGVLGALARRADELYIGLDSAGQEAARQLFLRLVTLGEGTEDTRRRVLRAEVEALAGDLTPSLTPERGDGGEGVIAAVIELFGRHRLLTFDRDPITRGPTVEVAHESLLCEWGRLRELLDTSRNDIRMQRLLATAAAEWREANQDPSFLLRGMRLDQFAGWAGTTSLKLTPEERVFLEASLADRAARRAEEEARQRRELETTQKLLALSESQRLAAEANTLMQGGGNAELAALLSLRALNTAYTTQADIALQQASKGDYGKQLFLGHTAFVTSVALSPDGKLALTGSADATARLWNVKTGQELRRFSEHTNIIEGVAFSPDGKVALTGSHDKTARLWDVQTGQEVRRFSGHTAGIIHVAFSPDGKVVLTSSHDKTVRLWDVQTGQEVRAFIHLDWVLMTAFSPDGQTILTGCHDSQLRLWALRETGQEVRVVGGVSGGVSAVAFSPDGRYVLAGDGDGQVRFWDLRQPNAKPRLFIGHTSTVRGVAFSPDGKTVLTGSEDTTVRLWNRQTGQEMRRIAGTSHITSIALSPDGQELLVGYFDSTARLWAIQPPPDPQTLVGHTNVVTIARFSPDGRYVLTGSRDKTARLWDARTGQEVRQFIGHTDWVFDLAFSPDGRYALTAGNWDKTARLWDVETGQEVYVFAHPDSVFAVAFSPDGRSVLTGCQDRIARLWDLQALGGEVRTFTGYTGPVTGVAFSPDGRYILTGGYNDKLAHLWDLQKMGREVRVFPDFSGRGTGIAFSPDGSYLLTAASDYTAQLWDLRQPGQPLGRFKGDNVAFSPDGQYFLTGGLKTARLADADYRHRPRPQ